MARVRFSRQARKDLIAIWRGIAPLDAAAADRVVRRIEVACLNLSRFPALGPRRPDLHPQGRILVIDHWLVLYRVASDAVRVIRVLDGRRDLTRL